MAQKTEGHAHVPTETLAQVGPPANLPVGGDDDFAKAEMQAAMQRALARAGKESVADIPTVEAPPSSPVVETAPPSPPVTEATPPAPPPDVSAEALAKAELPPDAELEDYVNGVKKDYLDLATDIRSYRTASIERLDPQRDLPTEWAAAYATFNNVKTFAQDYRKEKDPTKKAQILKKIQLNGDKDLWQRIYDNVSTGLQRLQAEPIPAVSADVPAEALAQVGAPAKAEVPVAPEVQPVEAPPAAPAAPEVVAPPASDVSAEALAKAEVTPPAVTKKKPPAARATHEKKKKRVPAKKEMESVAASTPTSAEQVEGRVYGLSMTADEVKRYRTALAKAVRKVNAKPAESVGEAFNPKTLLTNINRRYDELAEEMKAEHIEPAEVLFAMRPVSAIEARLQMALDARKATKNPAARAVAEREARAAYDELMGPATMAVHEAIGRKRASHDALEAGVIAAGGAAAKTPSGGPKPEEIQLEEPPAETLESSTPPESSAAALMFPRPAGSVPSKEQMPHIDERIEKAQQALAARSAELDKKAESLGSAAERIVRSIGERYNRLSMKQKLLIGGALAAGAVGASVATGGASIWWTFGILSGYRAVAGAGVFVAAEGALQHAKEKGDHWWNRHPKVYAATVAALIASGLVGKGVGFVAETSGASGWLKAHWPFGSGTPEHPAGPKPPVGTYPPSEYIEPPSRMSPSAQEMLGRQPLPHGLHPPPIPHPEAITSPTPEVLPSVPAVPILSVEVKPGYGYESMIRELTGQLKGQNPNLYPADSDAYRLLNATPERLNSVILQIEKEHDFVKPDGSSTAVGLGSRMSFDAQGMLAPENTLAPRGAVATPETPRAGATAAPPIERGPTATDLNRQELSRIQAGLPPEPIASQLDAQELERISASQAQPVPESIPISYSDTPFTNHFNVPVDPTQGGIYQGPNNELIAFANDPARAMATAEEWARGHHRTPIWVQAPEPYMDQGVPRPYAIPVEHRGFFGGGMHHGTLPPNTPPPKDWMGAMNPNTFTKRLH
ncbi:MAG: hypothetical protein Q8P36_02600 [bacterium]|nr:hypothetical protein [bacterium]